MKVVVHKWEEVTLDNRQMAYVAIAFLNQMKGFGQYTSINKNSPELRTEYEGVELVNFIDVL